MNHRYFGDFLRGSGDMPNPKDETTLDGMCHEEALEDPGGSIYWHQWFIFDEMQDPDGSSIDPATGLTYEQLYELRNSPNSGFIIDDPDSTSHLTDDPFEDDSSDISADLDSEMIA